MPLLRHGGSGFLWQSSGGTEMLSAMADETSIEFVPADLASGDGKSLGLDRSGLEIARIQSSQHPLLGAAYEKLWAEFGAQHEMELREVIENRLAWYPAARMRCRAAEGRKEPDLVHASRLPGEECWMRYEIFLVKHQGQFAAVRDHTAIVTQRYGVT